MKRIKTPIRVQTITYIEYKKYSRQAITETKNSPTINQERKLKQPQKTIKLPIRINPTPVKTRERERERERERVIHRGREKVEKIKASSSTSTLFSSRYVL